MPKRRKPKDIQEINRVTLREVRKGISLMLERWRTKKTLSLEERPQRRAPLKVRFLYKKVRP